MTTALSVFASQHRTIVRLYPTLSALMQGVHLAPTVRSRPRSVVGWGDRGHRSGLAALAAR
jgi:hypothetical protein